MGDEPLKAPNGNGSEDAKLRDAAGRIILYLLKHLPVPGVAFGGWLWWQSSNPQKLEAGAPTKDAIRVEVQAQLEPLKNDLSSMKSDMAEMKGYLRGLQLAKRNGGGQGAGLSAQ